MKVKAIALTLTLIIVISFAGCSKSEYSCKKASYCGTFLDISLKVSSKNRNQMDNEIQETLDRLENCFGLNIQGSELNRINALHFAEKTELSEDMYDILQLSKELYAESDGAFDPSLLKLSELWGFAPTAKSEYRVPEFYEIAIALSTCDF